MRNAFILWLLLCFNLSAWSQEPLHKVKFSIYHSKIFFTAHILDSSEIQVLFDPGTTAYMHSGTAQKNKINYSEVGKMANSETTKEINIFENFGVAFDGFTDTFTRIRSQATAPYERKRVDMVFGKEWVDKYVVEINYDSNMIFLYEQLNYRPNNNYKELKTIGWNRYPIIKVLYTFDNNDSMDLNSEINPGSEVGFQIDKYITRKLDLEKVQKNRGYMRLYGPSGKGVEGMLTRAKAITLAGYRRTLVRGAVFKDGYSIGSGEFAQAQIGQGFLKYYNLVFDKLNNKLYIKQKNYE